VFMLMPPEGFRYVSGMPKAFARSDLERPVTREFCETCGTHIVTRRPGLNAVILKVGRSMIRACSAPANGDLCGRSTTLPHHPREPADPCATAAALMRGASRFDPPGRRRNENAQCGSP
jgi:hypothetical protein